VANYVDFSSNRVTSSRFISPALVAGFLLTSGCSRGRMSDGCAGKKADK